jgi:CheY-like chemotaxis protein
LALINDILDLSKVESGTVTVDVVDVPLAEVRDQVEQTFRHMAQPKNLEFAIHIDQRLPRAIRTDHKCLLQVIKNLLSNAFKFTSKGGIDLRVEPASSGWSFDHESLNRARQVIAFTVADTGIGIPAEKQQVIFEAFQQADGSTSRKYGGTGLGLAISRKVAILLGGELRLVSSLVDRGSAFTLFLPIDYEPPPASVRADNPATESRLAGGSPLAGLATASPWRAGAAMPLARDPATAAQTPAAALKNKVVLVVDDDVRNLLALSALLQRHEAKVLTAESGKDALEALARGDGVDIILMDIMMPQMDGYATIAAVRQMPRFKGVPIIALTAKAMKGDREKCLEAGASDYIAKPVDPDQLLSLLHACLYR